LNLIYVLSDSLPYRTKALEPLTKPDLNNFLNLMGMSLSKVNLWWTFHEYPTSFCRDISHIVKKTHLTREESFKISGILRSGKIRESQGILSSQGKSGKVRENREGQGKVREF